MNLKLSSAKRVETGVHHLSAYHLPCSCAAVLDRMPGDDVGWRFMLNVKLLLKSWDAKRCVCKGVLTGRLSCVNSV